jgi:hypothetical protein
MKLILNEKKMVNEYLNGKSVDEKPTNTIRLLVKHYFSIGMNKSQVIDNIEDFFNENMNGYNNVKWQTTIERIVNSIHKSRDYSLLVIECINITKSELDTIRNLKNARLERLAFSLLVYAKIYNQMNNNNSNWVNAEHKYIFSDAKVAVKVQEQSLMLHKLAESGLIEVSKMVNCTNVKVNFVDENSENIITISDFRNFVYEYLKYCGEKIGRCEGENCGILFRINSNKHKYCRECWKEKEKEIKRETWHKNKEKYRC